MFNNREYANVQLSEQNNKVNYIRWLYKKDQYIKELDLIAKTENYIAECINDFNIKANGSVYNRIMIEMVSTTLARLKEKQSAFVKEEFLIFPNKKTILLNEFESKIYVIELKLETLQHNLTNSTSSENQRSTALVEIIDSKLLAQQDQMANERAEHASAMQKQGLEHSKLKEKYNEQKQKYDQQLEEQEETHQQKNKELQVQLDDISSALLERTLKYKVVAKKTIEFENLLNVKQEEVIKLKENIRAYEQKEKEYIISENKAENLSIKNKEITEENTKLSKVNKHLIIDIHHLTRENTELTKNIQIAEGQLELQKQESNTNITNITQELTKERQTYDQLQTNCNTLKKNLQAVRTEKEKLLAFCATLSENKTEPFLKGIAYLEKSINKCEEINNTAIKTMTDLSSAIYTKGNLYEEQFDLRYKRFGVETRILEIIEKSPQNYTLLKEYDDATTAANVLVEQEKTLQNKLAKINEKSELLQEKLSTDILIVNQDLTKAKDYYTELSKLMLPAEKESLTIIKTIVKSTNEESPTDIGRRILKTSYEQNQPNIIKTTQSRTLQIKVNNLQQQYSTLSNIEINPSNNNKNNETTTDLNYLASTLD
jgi:hypothetical protein